MAFTNWSGSRKRGQEAGEKEKEKDIESKEKVRWKAKVNKNNQREEKVKEPLNRLTFNKMFII